MSSASSLTEQVALLAKQNEKLSAALTRARARNWGKWMRGSSS